MVSDYSLIDERAWLDQMNADRSTSALSIRKPLIDIRTHSNYSTYVLILQGDYEFIKVSNVAAQIDQRTIDTEDH